MGAFRNFTDVLLTNFIAYGVSAHAHVVALWLVIWIMLKGRRRLTVMSHTRSVLLVLVQIVQAVGTVHGVVLRVLAQSRLGGKPTVLRRLRKRKVFVLLIVLFLLLIIAFLVF